MLVNLKAQMLSWEKKNRQDSLTQYVNSDDFHVCAPSL